MLEELQGTSIRVVVVAAEETTGPRLVQELASIHADLASPRGAVAHILGRDPDVVVVDGHLDGVPALLRRLRRYAGFQDTPVLALGPGELLEAWEIDDVIPEDAPSAEMEARLLGWARIRRTERRAAAVEGRLKERRGEVSRAIAGLSRELRAPLNPIMGFADLLLERGRDGLTADELQRYVGFIQSAGAQMLGFLDDLLDFARLAEGRLELHLRWTDLSDLVSWTARSLQGLCERRRITLSIADAPLGLVYVDPTRLRQILATLLSESVRGTASGDAVSLEVVRSIDEVQFFVRGGGAPRFGEGEVASDPVEHLARSADAGQEGFALALARGLVRAHGGRLSVIAAFPSGTVYVASLPQGREGADPEGGDPPRDPGLSPVDPKQGP